MILLTMTLMNSVCTSIAFISSFAPNRKIECHLFLDSTMSLVGTYLMNSLISFLRYDMAKLASKAKLAKKNKTIALILFSTLFSYSWVPILGNIANGLGYHSILLLCEPEPKKNLHKNPFFVAIAALVLFLIIAKGFICNISMIFFVMKSNSQPRNESTLVPWKSTNSKMEEDLQIPIRATLGTTLMTLSVAVVSALIIFNVYSDSESPQVFIWPILIHYVTACILPILLVIFTVKKQAKVHTSQPPQKLQFHDEEIELSEVKDFRPSQE